MSPELTFEIREAIYNRNNMIELKEELKEKIDKFDIHIKQSDRPKEICEYIIQQLNINFNIVYEMKNMNEKFNYYRNIMEDNGILVYQAKEIDIKEMRGMALYFDKLPLYHIDMLYHKKDGTHITKEELGEKLKEIFKTDKWIIDGNYQKTLELRINECDTIFLLDFPTQVCLEGAKSRIGQKETICLG